MKEYRRIQKTGEATFIISLPKKWAGINNVGRGTEAAIRENEDGSLTISVKKEKQETEAVINSSPDLGRMLQKVMAAYLAGHERIVINGGNAAFICEEARSRLSGLEIIDEKPDQGILAVLSGHGEFEISGILSRMHSISLALLELALRAVKGEKGLENEVSRRETEIDRLYILALRVINTQATKVGPAVCNALVAKISERISDHAEALCIECAKSNGDRQPLVLISTLKDLYKDIFQNFQKIMSSDAALARLTAYQGNLAKTIRKCSPASRPVLERCMRISEYLFDIAEITEDVIAISSTSEHIS